MTACNLIELLISSKEKERLRLELKSIRSLNDRDQRGGFLKTLGYEFVALANTFGGKLLLGVNDDGTLDGKYEGNVDEVKRDIMNICRDNISPYIDCQIEFIECEKGDVFQIHIPHRKLMPHAHVTKGKDEVKSRIYYVRTSHGKKLASDLELHWMFHNKGYPTISKEFSVVFEFSKTLIYCSPYFPHGGYHVNNFINQLTSRDEKKILADNENFRNFVLEIFPLLVLSTISSSYQFGWHIHITPNLFGTFSGPINTPSPEESNVVNIADLKEKCGPLLI